MKDMNVELHKKRHNRNFERREHNGRNKVVKITVKTDVCKYRVRYNGVEKNHGEEIMWKSTENLIQRKELGVWEVWMGKQTQDGERWLETSGL